jgi:hypothetical protein
MKKGDILIGEGEAWRITDPTDPKSVKVIQVAGPEAASVRTEAVPKSFVTGRTLYRAVADLSSLDVTLAKAEITRYVDTGELGWEPSAWVTAFLRRYEGEQVPDRTTLLGWFANLIEAGSRRRYQRNDDRLTKMRKNTQQRDKHIAPKRKTVKKTVKAKK